MEGRRVLRSMTLRNILSFGPEEQKLEFEPLNVLIGPNGSGKSNLLEILNLIRSLPRDVSVPIREGGGIQHWISKIGDADGFAVFESAWNEESQSLVSHAIAFRSERYQFHILGEQVLSGDERVAYLYSVGSGLFSSPAVYTNDDFLEKPDTDSEFKQDQSIFAQMKFYARYPDLAYLSKRFSEIRLYRKWTFGPGSEIRKAQGADLPGDFLLENASNLGIILNSLTLDRRSKATLIDSLRKLYSGVVDIHARIVSGYVEINIEEEDGRLIPAVRLSDGTLRYLSLLAVLCHPEPPPLVCIEEPELGLHPDIIPTIANLLIDASKRTQLIVTTHSAELVSALGEFPESVVVCERGSKGTTMKRLEKERLKTWLERYSLGELWLSGEIGGTL